jgi:general secretion pathway protein G
VKRLHSKGLTPGQRGLTLVELIIALVILGILAAAALPMAEVAVTRNQEVELRRSLRDIRTAIDAWKADYDRAVVEKKIIAVVNATGYPESLDVLVAGNDWGGLYPFKRKYLRRIPVDPFDENEEGWGLRAYQDDPDAFSYGGTDVYDVYSQSTRRGLDGTEYRTW